MSSLSLTDRHDDAQPPIDGACASYPPTSSLHRKSRQCRPFRYHVFLLVVLREDWLAALAGSLAALVASLALAVAVCAASLA